MQQMSQTEQSLVREAFRHLVTSEGTRAVLTRPEVLQLLGKTSDGETVIEKLISTRLLVATEGEKGVDRIEIVHEALLSAWPRLVKWRQEMAEGARLRDQLRAAARQWQERNRPKGLLWRDEALTEYQLWRTRYQGNLTELEDAFGKASIAEANRAKRLRQILTTVAATVLIAGLVVLVLMNKQTRNALAMAAANAQRADQSAKQALLEKENADTQRKLAEENAKQAQKSKIKTLEALEKAKEQSKIAEKNAATAQIQQTRAEKEAKRANEQTKIAKETANKLQESLARIDEGYSEPSLGGSDWVEEFADGVKIGMVLVPGGTFQMGSPADEENRKNNETLHTVTISAFYIGKYEVTQKQWKAVAGLPKVRMNLEANPSATKADNLPVEQVSWEETVEFCERLSRATGRKYRLPTEAEWEYACRAGTTGEYAGNLDDMAWYNKNSDSKTHRVGKKKPNAWGIYDMHGNVFEWCSDWYGDYPTGTVVAPSGASSGLARVIRGGCWKSPVFQCRSAGRSSSEPNRRGDNIFTVVGLRLVMTINGHP